MKEYIRTTHDFDNNTREWVYRGDPGQEKKMNRGITIFLKMKLVRMAEGNI